MFRSGCTRAGTPSPRPTSEEIPTKNPLLGKVGSHKAKTHLDPPRILNLAMHVLHPAFALPGSFRFGRLRIPVYGLFATAGLISALALSQRTARFRNLDPDKLWDAGMFAIVAAFVSSRVLLILTHLEASITFPFLMLTVPSLTYTGMFLTALLTAAFLRWQRLPLLRTLDAWAPCAAFLAAILQLGHYFEGTAAGMPTSLPWGILTPGDTILGRVHPVQIYAFVTALALTEFLLSRLKRIAEAGLPTAYALILGGLASFLLDFLRQPTDSQSLLWLEPSQFIALAAVIAGAVLFFLWPASTADPSTLQPTALTAGTSQTDTADQNSNPTEAITNQSSSPTGATADQTASSPSANGATLYQRGAKPHETPATDPEGLKTRPMPAKNLPEPL